MLQCAKAKLLGEQRGPSQPDEMKARDELEFWISEYVQARATNGETDPSVLHREMVQMLDDYLADADLEGAIDTSRY